MFPIRVISTPTSQSVSASYAPITGSDITLTARGNASAPCRAKYNFSFHAPAPSNGLVLIRLFRSLVQSGLSEFWEPVAVTITRPVKITAGAPKRVCIDFHDQLASGIPAGYDLSYRAEIKLADGSEVVSIHNGIAPTSTHLELDFSYSTRNLARVTVKAEAGVSAEFWTGVVEVIKLSAETGVSAEVWAGAVELSAVEVVAGVTAVALTDWTDPLLIGPPTATSATSVELGYAWEPISGTVLTVPAIAAGYAPHYAVLSFEVPVSSAGASGGQADFKAERSIDGGDWADVSGAVDNWSGPVDAEDSMVLAWTIDQTAGIGSEVAVQYRLSGQTATVGFEVSVNANGTTPERTYKIDYNV